MKTTSSLEAIKALREKTGASLNDVRQALEQAGGDEAKALDYLRQRGAQIAETRGGRVTGQGRVGSYLHHDGRLGALVEVHCETDFVARTPDFIQFCGDVAMQVAAMRPVYLSKDQVAADAGLAPEQLAATCLLDQPFVKDGKTTIGQLLQLLVAKTGEKVIVWRFTRFAIGEAPSTVTASA